MNLRLLSIATRPLRMIGLVPGRPIVNAVPDHQRRRRDHAAQWSHDHGIDAAGVEPAEAPGLRHRPNVGEGRRR